MIPGKMEHKRSRLLLQRIPGVIQLQHQRVMQMRSNQIHGMAGMLLPLLRTHKVNGMRQLILVTTKAGNQMDGVAHLIIGVAKETILGGPQGD